MKESLTLATEDEVLADENVNEISSSMLLKEGVFLGICNYCEHLCVWIDLCTHFLEGQFALSLGEGCEGANTSTKSGLKTFGEEAVGFDGNLEGDKTMVAEEFRSDILWIFSCASTALLPTFWRRTFSCWTRFSIFYKMWACNENRTVGTSNTLVKVYSNVWSDSNNCWMHADSSAMLGTERQLVLCGETSKPGTEYGVKSVGLSTAVIFLFYFCASLLVFNEK
jgi:hypothetical protein